ncbi:MAG: tRNA preQ1(34) S-adenosylmethionine ribosyltransferase-isomerase QueA, partial [Thermoanaerobaculia bacterium]|nr:tRNA preQ1(34) S-adenosylmethionine ribosyltransferase-isomerase QueA [Thermoanaerobaculia bacterium]
GHVPLPPYIRRPDDPRDRHRYQTVYASAPGAIAAPTAGLHFRDEDLDALRRRGIEIEELTLHVGIGTFRPVAADRVEDHHMHAERYRIDDAAWRAVERARAEGRRVVAVGTTVVRTLETVAATAALEGRTDLFIVPGFAFRAVDVLLTNFHLPRSTLLMLVAAFAGTDRVLAAYREAVRERYRFYSYGDAMLLEKAIR